MHQILATKECNQKMTSMLLISNLEISPNLNLKNCKNREGKECKYLDDIVNEEVEKMMQ